MINALCLCQKLPGDRADCPFCYSTIAFTRDGETFEVRYDSATFLVIYADGDTFVYDDLECILSLPGYAGESEALAALIGLYQGIERGRLEGVA